MMATTPQLLDWVFSDATHQLMMSHLVQVVIVAACCIAAAQIFKRYAYFCYLLLFLGILKCLIPPVVPGPLGFLAPSDSAIVRFDTQANNTPALDPEIATDTDGQQSAGKPLQQIAGSDTVPPSDFAPNPQLDIDPNQGNAPLSELGPQEHDAISPILPSEFSQDISHLILPSLIFLGLIGGGVLIFRFLAQLRQLRATVNPKLSQQWQPRLDALVAKAGLAQVRLWVSDKTFAPSAFGIFRPTVVIPARLLKRASDQEIEMVMLHELMHIRRRDSLFAAFQTFAVCIWWFNPLVWILSRNLSRQRELCCDLDTVAFGGLDRSEYGHCLLNVMQQIPKSPKQLGFGISPFFQIKQRLENIMALRKERNRLSRLLSASTLLMVAALMLTGASFPMNTNNNPENTRSPDATDQHRLYFETENAIVEYLPRPYGQQSDTEKLRSVFPKRQQMSNPTVSPDGGSLAFSSMEGDKRRLWVTNSDGESKPVSPEHGQNFIEQIQWSPDGQLIAYRTRSVESSSLYLVKPDGSEHRKVSAYRGQYSEGVAMYDEFCWSPDGSALAVAKVIEININIFGSMERVTRNAVLVIHHLDRKGKDQRVEKHGIGERQLISNLAWSPDNQWLAFVSNRKLKVIAVEGDEKEKVLISEIAPGAKPIWSRDSQSLLIHNASAASPQPPGAVIPKKSYAFWIVPLEGDSQQIPVDFDVWNYAWDDQNESILATGRGHRLYQVTHGGTVNVLSEGTGFWGEVQLNPGGEQERERQEPQRFQSGVQNRSVRPKAPPVLRPEQMTFPEEKATTNDEGLPAITYPLSRAGKRWAETANGGARVSINEGIEYDDVEYHISLTWTLLAIKEGKTIWSHHISAFWNHLEVTELELEDKSTKKVLALRNKRRDEMKDFVEYYDLESGEKIEVALESTEPAGVQLKVDRSWRGGDALNDEPAFHVITTQEEWAPLREKLFGDDSEVPVDAFDPDGQILIVIASGTSTNCGGISPASAFESDDEITVRIFRHTYQTDGNGKIEHPYGVFALPKSLGKNYIFQRNQQGLIGGPEIWKTFNEFKLED